MLCTWIYRVLKGKLHLTPYLVLSLIFNTLWFHSVTLGSYNGEREDKNCFHEMSSAEKSTMEFLEIKVRPQGGNYPISND